MAAALPTAASFVSVPMLGSLFLPDTASYLEIAYSLFGVFYLTAGLNEVKESTATPYSKFAQVSKAPQIASRLGMFVIYCPAFIVVLAWLMAARDTAVPRAQLFALLLAAHFAKRLVEVQFVHVYSGTMDLGKAMAVISFAYASNAYMTTRLVHAIPADGFNGGVVVPGVLLFVAGQATNAYHHVLLARLRRPGSGGAGAEKTKRYSVPVGGLFDSTCLRINEAKPGVSIFIESHMDSALHDDGAAGCHITEKKWMQACTKIWN